MSGILLRIAAIGLALGLGAGAWAQTPAALPSPRKTPPPKTKKSAPPKAQVPPQPEPQAAPPQPVAPPRPYEMSPVAPLVTYQNGQLSITAPNSTLSSILSAVKARTGAQIDMPPDAANDRVAVQLGPGNPRDVVASLLQGSRFDYIVLGSPNNPLELSQVILTAHQGAGGTGASTGGTSSSQPSQSAESRANPQQPLPRVAGGAGRPEIASDDDEPPEPPQPVTSPAEEAQQPVIVQPNPGQPNVAQPNVAQPPFGQPAPGVQTPAPDGAQQNPNQVKTPEQMLQFLQHQIGRASCRERV